MSDGHWVNIPADMTTLMAMRREGVAVGTEVMTPTGHTWVASYDTMGFVWRSERGAARHGVPWNRSTGPAGWKMRRLQR